MAADRQRLVAAAGVRRNAAPTAVRFVDLESRQVEGTVTLPGEFSRVTATAWIRGRVLVVVSASSATRVYAVDPDRLVTISQIEFPGTVVLGERAREPLVLLLAAPNKIGPATLAVVDQSLRVRTVVLEKIAVGTATTGDGAEGRLTIRRPALALGPSGQRAFVIGAGEPPAAIDLRTLSVRYAPVRLTAAANKRVEGSMRRPRRCPTDASSSAQASTGHRNRRHCRPLAHRPQGLVASGAQHEVDVVRVAGGVIFAPRRNRRRPTDHPPIRFSPRTLPHGVCRSRHRRRAASVRHLLRHGYQSGCRRAWHRPRCPTPRARLPSGRRRTADHRLNQTAAAVEVDGILLAP